MGKPALDLQKTCSALQKNHPAHEISEAEGSERISLPGGFKTRGKMPANTSQGGSLSAGRVERPAERKSGHLRAASTGDVKVTADSNVLPGRPRCSGYAAIWS